VIQETAAVDEEQKQPAAAGKKKGGKQEYEEESIEFSTNLVRVYEKRYSRFPMELEIFEQVKDYFKLCIESGNHY